MAITYDAGTNIIQIVGYTESTPCNFTDIYNEDKAGTLSLHARTGITGVDADPVAVDRAERPADYVVLGGTSNDLYITIANWVGTTATIQITGTDRDGTAQTEDIVVTANGDYYTTKWFKTITQTQVTAFTGTSFDYDLTQGQWGVVWKQGDQYVFDAAITIGDGSTATWFADTSKEIINTVIVDGNFIKVLANANFRIGELVDAAKHVTKYGCAFRSLPTDITTLINSAVPVYLYSSYFSVEYDDARLTCALGSRLWNSVVAKNLYPRDSKIDIVNVMSSGNIGLWATETTGDNWILMDYGYAIIGAFSDTFSIKNAKIIGASHDFYILYLTGDCYAINTEAGWLFRWESSPNAVVYRQYEFDLKVIDKDNTPIDGASVKIWDRYMNLIVDTTTGADGTIATQTISRGYYNQANGSTLQEYSPHLIKIEKTGYTTYEADFTLEEKTDWTIALQGVLKRNPAMTGGMV